MAVVDAIARSDDFNTGSNSHKSGMDFIKECVKCSASSNRKKFEECFQLYDVDNDGFLSQQEFTRLCKDVFLEPENQELETLSVQMLKLLDTDQDGKLSKEEFKVCWCYWLKQVLEPVSALVIVDVQNDFIEGSLSLKQCPAGQCGLGVIPVVNKLLETVNFDVIVYSKDWHPKDHISFVDNVHLRPFHHSSQVKSAEEAKLFDTVVFESDPPTEQKLWPTHCVQGTWGAELHKNLKILENGYIIKKGSAAHRDSYSSFWDNDKCSQTELLNVLSKNEVTDVYCCGLAYDLCVGFTAGHSIEHGFRTVLIEDACRGINLCDVDHTRSKLKAHGGVMVDSSQVKDMVDGKARNAELGLQAALNVNVALNILKAGKV